MAQNLAIGNPVRLVRLALDNGRESAARHRELYLGKAIESVVVLAEPPKSYMTAGS
jgi:hypothetical protein